MKAIKVLAMAMIMSAMVAAMPVVGAAKEYKLTVVSGHPPIFLWVTLCRDFFIPEVDKRMAEMGGEDKIVWNQAYGGTLAKLGGCLEAIEAGIADMGLVATVFNASNMPLHNVSYMTPFGTDSILDVVDTMAELQESVPELADEWTRHNQVYLGGVALDTYQVFTNFPVKTVDDLDGHKLAAPGPSANWIKGTGAVAVAADLNTYYNGIKTGVYEGTLVFSTAANAIKIHEVAPYVCLVNFGAQYASGLSINKDVFETFSPEVRKIFKEVGEEYAKRLAKAQAERAAAALESMEKDGAKITRLSYEERKRWAEKLPNVPMTWAETMEKQGLPGPAVLKGYLDGLRSRGTTLPRDWDK